MADEKITQKTALTTPAGGDLLYIVDDPSGTPIGKKITLTNLFTYAPGTIDLTGITDGNVPYMSASGFADSMITYDSTNNRVGFNTASPIEDIDLLITQNSSTRFLVRNYSTGTNARAGIGWRNAAAAGSDAYLHLTGQNYDGVSGWDSRWIVQTGSQISNGILFYASSGSIQLSRTGSNAPDFYMDTSGNVGIGTASPGQILDVNQGSGNMIADGYSTHSLAEYKEDIAELTGVLTALKKATPKEYKRKPRVSADEIRKHLIDKLGEEAWDKEFPDNDYRGGKLRTISDRKMLKEADKFADKLRKERGKEAKWSRKRYGLVANDPDTLEYLPEVVSKDDEGNPTGISLGDYIGALHAGIVELAEKVERLS